MRRLISESLKFIRIPSLFSLNLLYMVLKKWSYILVAAWLINALVCFHTTNFYGSENLIKAQKASNEFSDNTLLDIFFNHVAKQNDHHPHKRISHRNRFVSPRLLDFNIQLPSFLTFQYLAFTKTIPIDHFVFWENRPFLSPLHHFLFRLSPF
jgi:hypothetical protein